MSGRLRTFSLIGTGALAGIAISLGISAYAFRDSRGPIPLEEIRQFTDVFAAVISRIRGRDGAYPFRGTAARILFGAATGESCTTGMTGR